MSTNEALHSWWGVLRARADLQGPTPEPLYDYMTYPGLNLYVICLPRTSKKKPNLNPSMGTLYS